MSSSSAAAKARAFTLQVPAGWRVERVELVPNDGTNRMRALRFPVVAVEDDGRELGPAPIVGLERANRVLFDAARPALTKAGKKKGVHGKRCGNERCGERSGPRASVCMCGWDFVKRAMPGPRR